MSPTPVLCSCGEYEPNAGFDLRLAPQASTSGQWEFHSETECRMGGRTIMEKSRTKQTETPGFKKWGTDE